MTTWRGEIEAAAVARIQAADTGHAFSDVHALSGLLELREILTKDNPKEPFCLVKYDGASARINGDGHHETVARLVVVVGCIHYGGHDKRRASLQDLLEIAQGALMAAAPWPGMGPWEWITEEGLAIDESGLEVWSQTYNVPLKLV